MFGRLACALGIHKWSDWNTFPGTGYRERRCCQRPDCDVVQRRFA